MGYFLACALQSDPLNAQSHTPVLVSTQNIYQMRN